MQLINMSLTENLEFSRPYDLAKNSTSRMSEDCLYLNVYAPADSTFMINKKPIMIVIHGGDGSTGKRQISLTIFVTDCI